jgi:hypothetical protein
MGAGDASPQPADPAAASDLLCRQVEEGQGEGAVHLRRRLSCRDHSVGRQHDLPVVQFPVPDSSARLHGRGLVSAVHQGVASSVRQRLIRQPVGQGVADSVRQRVADSVCRRVVRQHVDGSVRRRVVFPVPQPFAAVGLHGHRVALGRGGR